MNLRSFVGSALVIGGCVAGFAQGFSNLGFETASVPSTSSTGFGTDVAVTAGFPGWKGYIGGNEVSTVLHNNLSLGSPALAILGPDWGTARGIIEGSYTAALMAGLQSEAALGQTGTVPGSAESILFKATPGRGALSLSLAGTAVPIFSLGANNGVVQYGADISAWKGATTELRFTAEPLSDSSVNIWYVDSIQFSTQSVPEPSACALLALGAALSAILAQRHVRKTRG